jgi:Na+/proline symporter
LLIAGVFAASMSSVDSSLNSVATAVVTDFYQRLRAQTNDAGRMRLARIVTVAFGAVGTAFALFMAQSDVRSLWDRFNELMGLLGGGLAGLFILGIFTRRANAPGALVGLAASAVVQYLVKTHTNLIFFLYSTTGLLTCVAVGYAASFLFRGRAAPAAGLTLRR